MSDSVSLEMPDMAAFLSELNALPRQMKEKVMRGAVATGASVIRKAAISLAPVDKGNLQRAIYQVRMPEKGSPTSEVFKVDRAHGPFIPHRQGRKEGSEPGRLLRCMGRIRPLHARAWIDGKTAQEGAHRWITYISRREVGAS